MSYSRAVVFNPHNPKDYPRIGQRFVFSPAVVDCGQLGPLLCLPRKHRWRTFTSALFSLVTILHSCFSDASGKPARGRNVWRRCDHLEFPQQKLHHRVRKSSLGDVYSPALLPAHKESLPQKSSRPCCECGFERVAPGAGANIQVPPAAVKIPDSKLPWSREGARLYCSNSSVPAAVLTKGAKGARPRGAEPTNTTRGGASRRGVARQLCLPVSCLEDLAAPPRQSPARLWKSIATCKSSWIYKMVAQRKEL